MKSLELLGLNGIIGKQKGYLEKAKMKFQKLKGQKCDLSKPGSVNTTMAASHLPSPILAMRDFQRGHKGSRARPKAMMASPWTRIDHEGGGFDRIFGLEDH